MTSSTQPHRLPNGNDLVFRTTREMRKATCPLCHMQTQGEQGAVILQIDETGHIVEPRAWGHYACMKRDWDRQIAALENVEPWHEGTQRDMIEFMQSQHYAPHGVAVTFNYSRPRAIRYQWRALKENEVL